MKLNTHRSRISLLLVLAILLFTYGTFTAFATPPLSPYTPGETLDPACDPGVGDPNCTVKVLSVSNDGGIPFADNIFSLDFAGAGVTATASGGAVTLTIPGGAAALELYAENPGVFTAPIASGVNAVAIGDTTIASGDNSIALGYTTTASGRDSTAFGFTTVADGYYSTAFGNTTTAPSFSETSLGLFTTTDPSLGSATLFDATDRLLAIGNGNGISLDPDEFSNALTIFKDATFIINDDDTTWGGVAEETKMFFDVPNYAFRVGSVIGTEWEGVNIGQGSVAFGFAFDSEGDNAPIASGMNSTAFGSRTIASGSRSTAFGGGSTASGSVSTAFGGDTTASGSAATAFGNSNVASGNNSTAFGFSNEAPSYSETVLGQFATPYTTSVGGDTTFDATDRLFALGNGTSGIEHNALTIIKDGTFILNDDDTTWTAGEETKMFFDIPIQAFRVGSVTNNEWDPSNVGTGSVALGSAYVGLGFAAPKAIGQNSFAAGSGTTAYGNFSTAFGSGTTAANGDNSTAFGVSNTAGSYGETALGLSATIDATVGSTTVFDASDRLLVVGNGNGSGSDAFTILKNGSIGIGMNNFEAGTTGELLQVGTSSIIGAVARFTNSTGYCTINPTTTALVCVSDQSLKKEVESITGALDIITALRGVTYRWNSQSQDDTKTPGFIAQEVEQVIPEIIFTDPDTGLKTLASSLMIPYITKAIAELNDKVNLISAGTTAGAEIGEMVVDRLRAREICLDDLCIDRDSLQQILEATGANTVSESDPPAGDPIGQDDPSGGTPSDDGSGGTDENPDGTGDPIGQPDPEPEPDPEPVPDEPAPPTE